MNRRNCKTFLLLLECYFFFIHFFIFSYKVGQNSSGRNAILFSPSIERKLNFNISNDALILPSSPLDTRPLQTLESIQRCLPNVQRCLLLAPRQKLTWSPDIIISTSPLCRFPGDARRQCRSCCYFRTLFTF